ncbi:restriction endonuclease subunit S [Clostridium botulinum]|uniref:Restriction endonuclease subunit S n=1 Tax=Clostridium botulinum TaxID=1491 RepID=A0A846J5L2_CLOBO|nr:restriction endonuclease subunit S [Clostridium botulinum]ACA56258.1 type IC HsdS subunit [Clostridium botulinum A3 str. Loch Maree]NFH64707.1 restriction endonuclease subunit S [Clostridium botulinum]NFJ08521.1 restriction endonuclease subunit S [Clostridium botulinum]NFK14917.1 restriction endonuclease subunit S [Clostridium botulinum]NFM95251.1 restriction endonuclease subunit S [Clostridium botulinum]
MNKVPKLRFPEFSGEWKEKKCSNLFDKIRNRVDVEENKSYKQIGIRSHGKGIFYKEEVTGKELGNKRVFWVEPNVFIVNIVFAWERAVARTTENEIGMIASHRFPMYKPKKEILDLDYITYFFKTNKGKALLELASPGGAGRNKTLGQKEFDNLKIILPKVEEQKKIGSVILLIDKKIEKQQEKVEALKEYKKGIMQKIFSQEIRFKEDNEEEYPEWEEKKLCSLGETYTGLSGKTKDNFGFGSGKYITYMNVFKNIKINLDMIDFVDIEEDEKQNTVLKGDILFTTSSETPEEVGMASVCDKDIENLYLNSFCFGFRLNSFEKINYNFITYYLRSPKIRGKISILAQGSTRYNLPKTELMKMMIKVPCFEEQQKIANFLSKIDDKLNKEKEKLDLLKKWKKGLLQQMFV